MVVPRATRADENPGCHELRIEDIVSPCEQKNGRANHCQAQIAA